ncbi:hypothetical protein [Candidatus Solincola tengchongensis]|uniref:hypothetical protein n=1 Tax=Candidatus Solincola tengchongensis TaxID=2900693 RepID=UPI0025808560|nr:hypothetical protein [Candidatus Solincola tengchongensis]
MGPRFRLAYGSPRFSEGLDFAMPEDSLAGKVEELAAYLVRPHRQAEVSDAASKRWTYLVEIWEKLPPCPSYTRTRRSA